jgi:hypothetical protein
MVGLTSWLAEQQLPPLAPNFEFAAAAVRARIEKEDNRRFRPVRAMAFVTKEAI